MKRFVTIGISSIAAFTFLSGTAGAGAGAGAAAAPAKEKPIQIIVNNSYTSSEEAYLNNGTAMVPLHVVQNIPGITVSWNNPTKTVTITNHKEKMTLVAGQKVAKMGAKTLNLPVASALKNGRVMVPLRFIAESSDAYAAWNPKTRTVYVVKSSQKLKQQLSSIRLSEARSAAISFPRVSLLKEISPDPGTLLGQTFDYYFPEGAADRFFTGGGDVISYYEIVNGRSQEVWRARMDFSDKTGSDLFFIPYSLLEEDGQMPSIDRRVAFYHVMPHIGAADYGFIEPNGTKNILGTENMEMNILLEIPGEVRSVE